jgi:hypothetical protein
MTVPSAVSLVSLCSKGCSKYCECALLRTVLGSLLTVLQRRSSVLPTPQRGRLLSESPSLRLASIFQKNKAPCRLARIHAAGGNKGTQRQKEQEWIAIRDPLVVTCNPGPALSDAAEGGGERRNISREKWPYKTQASKDTNLPMTALFMCTSAGAVLSPLDPSCWLHVRHKLQWAQPEGFAPCHIPSPESRRFQTPKVLPQAPASAGSPTSSPSERSTSRIHSSFPFTLHPLPILGCRKERTCTRR